MDWIQIGTLCVSVGTLVKLFYDSHIKQKQIEKDRRISVIVDERRRMQRELFNHVTALLSIDRKVITYTIKRSEYRGAINDVQNHKINIWINLNRENAHQTNLRSECNKLATFLSGTLEDPGEKQFQGYALTTDPIRQKIWSLIDKYIEEEEALIQKLLDS